MTPDRRQLEAVRLQVGEFSGRAIDSWWRSDEGLAAILWENDRPSRVRLTVDGRGQPASGAASRPSASSSSILPASAGRLRCTLDFAGTTFQRKVWNALLTIPFGETRSYGQIARQIGNPTAVRAVGAANGRNPMSIVAPCHRVIGSTGELTGFAGGLDVKAYLLALEGAPTVTGHCRGANGADGANGFQ